MLREEQIEIIRKYVPEKYFDQDRLIKYLALHDMVGIEVFEYVARRLYFEHKDFQTVLPGMFEGKVRADEFLPQTVDTFVRRIPFNFYHEGDDIRVNPQTGEETQVWRPLAITDITYCVGDEPMSMMFFHRDNPLRLEDAYSKLEFLFYDKGYSLEEIFKYPENIIGPSAYDIYPDWFDYIDMCLELGWTDYMPKNFYYKYNLAREALGKQPIIFPIMEYDCEAWTRDREQVQFYKRKGNKLEFYGRFPYDENNEPVLRWIAVDIRDAEDVRCTHYRDLECHMTVTLTPKTVIYAQITERDEIGNELPDEEPKWVQIYAGPQTMSFNYKLMKQRRTELGYTQQEVADAVQANVRTYQKWENGETRPDGYYLLRILNWLDIPNVNDVIIYEDSF